MNAHLYRIPSHAANISDRIIIRDHPLNSYPGAWLSAELPLPDGFIVGETEAGDGFILTNTGEVITTVYTASGLKIDGTDYLGCVSVRTSDGREVIRKRLKWC